MPDIFIVFIITALGSIVVGAPVVPFLRRLKFGQAVRSDGPQKHLEKTGTPTMGGIIFLIPMSVAVLIVEPNLEMILLLALTWAFALLGGADDFLKIVLKRPLGLKARYKLGGQFLISFLFVYAVLTYLNLSTKVVIPFTGLAPKVPEWLFTVLVVGVIVSATNSVNLTDGLDGLAAGITVVVASGFVLLATWLGQAGLFSETSRETALFAAALGGGCLGFLLYNRHPARVFMGDTGSLAIGAAIAGLTVLSGTELFLPVFGGIFVAETLSVIIQVLSFRYRGKRVFLMSPLHHHFELKGWPEQKVVRRFWIASLVLVIISLLGLFPLLRGL